MASSAPSFRISALLLSSRRLPPLSQNIISPRPLMRRKATTHRSCPLLLPSTSLFSPKMPTAIQTRLAHSIPRPSAPKSTPAGQPQPLQQQPKKSSVQSQPHYKLTFTCVPCGHRSNHNVSKQGYHHGSVLITCPDCRNRHVISDHLGIFGDKAVTVEDLMREKGRLVKKGTLGEDGNIEFWEDEIEGNKATDPGA